MEDRDLSPAPYDVETTTAAWSKVDASRHMALGATTSDGTGIYLAEKLRGPLLFFPQYNKLPGHQCTSGNARCSLLFNEQYRNAFINYLSKFREVCWFSFRLNHLLIVKITCCLQNQEDAERVLYLEIYGADILSSYTRELFSAGLFSLAIVTRG